jgi:hypothetical protein
LSNGNTITISWIKWHHDFIATASAPPNRQPNISKKESLFKLLMRASPIWDLGALVTFVYSTGCSSRTELKKSKSCLCSEQAELLFATHQEGKGALTVFPIINSPLQPQWSRNDRQGKRVEKQIRKAWCSSDYLRLLGDDAEIGWDEDEAKAMWSKGADEQMHGCRGPRAVLCVLQMSLSLVTLRSLENRTTPSRRPRSPC